MSWHILKKSILVVDLSISLHLSEKADDPQYLDPLNAGSSRFKYNCLAEVSLISLSSEKERKPLQGSPRCSVTHARRDVNITSLSLFRHRDGVKIHTGYKAY